VSGERGTEDVWAGFTLDPRTPAHVDLRASDADRDRIGEVLGAAFADGRLDRTELDERTATLMSARTLGELPALVQDLVAPPRSPDPTTPTGALDLTAAGEADLAARAEQEWQSRRRGAIFAFLGPTLICWAVWLALEVGNPGSFPAVFPWPLIVTAATGFHALRTLTSRSEVVADELRRLRQQQDKALGRVPDERDER
jgi:hypothetical protein